MSAGSGGVQPSSGRLPQAGVAPPPPPAPKHKASDKPERQDKQPKRPAVTPFHHRLPAGQEACLDQDSTGGPQLALPAVDPPLDPLPGCKYPKPLPDSAKAPESLLHSPVSPLPPTLSPHPRMQDPGAPDPPDGIAPCPEAAPTPGLLEHSDTALYVAPLGHREPGGGWWRGYKTPNAENPEFRAPELPPDRLEGKLEPTSEGAALKR